MGWRALTRYKVPRGVVLLAICVAGCPLSCGAQSALEAAVAPQPVPEDRYPERHNDFPGGVIGLPDLVYSTVPGFRPLHLDLYRPSAQSKSTLHPFVVYVHGGGWQGGHTRQSGAFSHWPDVLATLAARGYVVASVEYRLSGEARFPAAEQDIKAAIRWLRSHAVSYGIDKSRGLIWGASAGGQLAALAATSCNVQALEPLASPAWNGEPGRAPLTTPNAAQPAAESDCVQGAVTWYGIFDFGTLASQRHPTATTTAERADSAEARYLGCKPSTCASQLIAAASPVDYVDRGDPPMLLVHGSVDHTVPVKQSQEMYDKLRAAGVPAELLLIPDVDHSFIGNTPAATQKASRTALAKVFEFIDATLGSRPRGAQGASH